MKNFIKIFRGTCLVNWAFIIMLGGLPLISITTQLSGCGNKGDLVLPSTEANKISVTTPNTIPAK